MLKTATALALALAAAPTADAACGSVPADDIKLLTFDMYAALADLYTSLNDNINDAMSDVASSSDISTLVNKWVGYYSAIKDISGDAQNDVLFGEGTIDWPSDDRFQTFKNISLTMSLSATGLTDVVTDDLYDELLDSWNSLIPWDGTLDALQQLRDAGYELAIMSNGDCAGLTEVADGWGFTFDYVFCSSNVGGQFKPEYNFYHQAADISGYDHDTQIMHVAGASFDGVGAKASGLYAAHNQVQSSSAGVNWMGLSQYEVDCSPATLLDFASEFLGTSSTSVSSAVAAPAVEREPFVPDDEPVEAETGVDMDGIKLVMIDFETSMISCTSQMQACVEPILTDLGVSSSVADKFGSKVVGYWSSLRDVAGMAHNPSLEWAYADPFDNYASVAVDQAAGAEGLSSVIDADTKASLMDCWGKMSPRSTVADAVADVQALGYKVGALSSIGAAKAKAMADSWGISLDVLVTSSDVSGGIAAYKPDAQLYNAILEATALTQDQILYVTGNTADLLGAKAFGFQAVLDNGSKSGGWINWIGNDEYTYDASISDLSGLAALVA